jgi:hypothetical protein
MPAGTTSLCFELGFPPAAIINRIVFQQSQGTDVGFTFNLYDSHVCYTVPSEDSVSEDPLSACDPAMYRVIPTQTGAAGDIVELYDTVYMYRNRDGSFSVPERKIYAEIVVDDASENTEWDLSITCRPFI